MADHNRPTSRDGFTIAVLCALPREANAVMALLDEEWEDAAQTYGKSPSDDNSYTFGLLGGKPIVLAYASMGKVAAASVSKDLKASFRYINLLLVVGVCGAAPKHPETGLVVNLGDIVVSTQVIQGDFGRQYEHSFERKTEVEDTLGRASPEIRHFITKLSGLHTEIRITDRTNKSLATFLHDPVYRKRFHYPARIDDELLTQEGVQHVALHFGRIISTDSVIKSAPYRDDAISRDKVVAFEMESAGTWEIAPTILVKRVCDYADSSKNKDWQDFAALSAASCAKAIAQEWVVRVEARAETVIARSQHTVAMYTELLKALKSINPDDNLMEAKGRTRGVTATAPTCEWVLESKEFKSWSEAGHDSILVISGEPGIGKTTIATVVVDRLRAQKQNSSSTVAYFFVNNRVEKQRTVLAILRSLMYQVLVRSPHLCESVQQQFDIFREGLFEKFTSIWPLFRQMPSTPDLGEVYFIVDALDECEEKDREELIRGLCSLLALPHSDGNASTKMKLLVLTRPNLIRELLGNHIGKEFHIQVRRRDIKDDLEFYIDKEVEKLVAKRQWNGGTHRAIRNELRSRHGGTFLWVALAVKNIARPKVRQPDVLQKLKQFPSGLTDVYIRILREINEVEPGYAPYVLRFVLASGSLSHWVYDTKIAILLHFGEKVKPGTRALPTLQEIQRLESSVEACKMILQDSLMLHFIHQSVKDFLTGQNLPHDLLPYATNDAKAIRGYRSALQGYLEAKEFAQLAEVDRAILKSMAKSKAATPQQEKKPASSYQFDHITQTHLMPFYIAKAIFPRGIRWTGPLSSEQGQIALLMVHLLIADKMHSNQLEEVLPSVIVMALNRGHSILVDRLFDSFANKTLGTLDIRDLFQVSIMRVRADGYVARALLSVFYQHQAELADYGIDRAQTLRFAIFTANVSFVKELLGLELETAGRGAQLKDTLIRGHWIIFRIKEYRQRYDVDLMEVMLRLEATSLSLLEAEGFLESRHLDGDEALRLCDLLKQFEGSMMIRCNSGLHGHGHITVRSGTKYLSRRTTDGSDYFKSEWVDFSINVWTSLDYALDLWRACRDDRRQEVVSFLADHMRDAQLLSDMEYRGLVEEFEAAKDEIVVDSGLDEMSKDYFDMEVDAGDINLNEIDPPWHERAIFRTKRAAKRLLLRGEAYDDWTGRRAPLS